MKKIITAILSLCSLLSLQSCTKEKPETIQGNYEFAGVVIEPDAMYAKGFTTTDPALINDFLERKKRDSFKIHRPKEEYEKLFEDISININADGSLGYKAADSVYSLTFEDRGDHLFAKLEEPGVVLRDPQYFKDTLIRQYRTRLIQKIDVMPTSSGLKYYSTELSRMLLLLRSGQVQIPFFGYYAVSGSNGLTGNFYLNDDYNECYMQHPQRRFDTILVFRYKAIFNKR